MWGRRPGRPGGCCTPGTCGPDPGREPPADLSASRSGGRGSSMEVIVKGRHTDVGDRFRHHVGAKVAKIGKLDPKVIRIDVEVSQERNPRQAARRERVELTIRTRGPVIRAEAAAADRYGAFDAAVSKLESRLRRVCERRRA